VSSEEPGWVLLYRMQLFGRVRWLPLPIALPITAQTRNEVRIAQV
jgi:hypothetical protein